MSERELLIPFNAPLNDLDSEEQTFGCRANNPDICANAYLPNVCAFVCKDKICKRPSRKWKKQFAELKRLAK